jgi:hypothetical protein
MSEKSLTIEQKEFISSLAVNSDLAKDVNKLREIKSAMLKGRSIEEIKQTFLKGKMQNHNQHPRAEPQEIVQELDKSDISENEYLQEVNVDEQLLKNQISLDTADISTADTERSDTDALELTEQVYEKHEDTSKLLRKTQEAVQQLNEIKLKYEVMNEFIHSHILEQKDQQISELLEKNKRLEKQVFDLKSTVQLVPNMSSEIARRAEDTNIQGKVQKKKDRKVGFTRFLKRNHSEDYIIRLFSNPKFTAEQISEIRLGIEADLSESQIKSYAKQELTVRQMKEIRMLYEMQNEKQRKE